MRTPVNIHVFLYRQTDSGAYEYAVFQRADNPKYWQGVSGGVEEGETTEQAARRELLEEAGIENVTAPLFRLDTVSYLPAELFAAHAHWGIDVVVCPMVHFAMPFDGEIRLSEEHTAVFWHLFPAAFDLVYWHDQKTALWELDQRLARGNLAR